VVLALLLLLPLAADTAASRTVEVAPRESLHTLSMGDGVPVVLIPGLIGGAYGYRQLMPPLAAQGYRVVVIEPLGVGESARPKHADYSLTAQADRIGRVLDSLGLSGVLLVSHSLGTSMALRLAYRRPELVRAVLSIDGGPAESASTPGLRRAMKFAPLLKLFVGRGTIRRQVRNGLIANSRDTSWVTNTVLDGYTSPSGRDVGATIDAFHGMADSHEADALRNHLADIRIPVRLMIGAAPHETAVGPDETEILRSSLPDFALQSVPGSGQYIHEEQPAAVVAAVVALDRATRR